MEVWTSSFFISERGSREAELAGCRASFPGREVTRTFLAPARCHQSEASGDDEDATR